MNIGSVSSFYLPSSLQAFDPTKAQLKSTLGACIACASAKTSSGQQTINNLENQLNAPSPSAPGDLNNIYIYSNKVTDPQSTAAAQTAQSALYPLGNLINVYA